MFIFGVQWCYQKKGNGGCHASAKIIQRTAE